MEVNDDLRRSVAQRYGVESAFTDLDSARAWRPDTAVIATPAPSHVALATQLADDGVHVLIEKPLSIRLDGVAALAETIRRRNVVAAVAYVYRCHPLLIAMRQSIQEQRFGRPVQLVAVAGQHFPFYRPAYRSIYYTNRATGGGAIQDALTHVVNAGEWLVGPITRLVADAEHQVLEGVDVEDTVHLIARHGTLLGSYSLNQHQAPNEMTITVICERGVVRCEFHEHRWRWAEKPGEPWQDATLAPLERDKLFVAQAHAFLDAVERKRPPLCSLEEGIQTLHVNLAALASVEQGCWQMIPTFES